MTKQPDKAYKNLEFLNSTGARPIRILCEYEEPRQRLLSEGIENTVVFFGSARAKEPAEAQRLLAEAEASAEAHPEDPAIAAQLVRLRRTVALSRYYGEIRDLAGRITEWGQNHAAGYVVASGGGPGIMEATNRGASDVEGGRSIGLGISLPFEQGVNEWVTESLAFEFHYFFTRKYWFLYHCKALVICPGGFGTLDEFFETLTLIQTGKISKRLPIVLYGRQYWDDILNLEAMAKWGTISEKDLELFVVVDTVDEAYEYITSELS